MSATSPPPSLQQRLFERTRPPGPVVMLQRWENLLFLHWKHDPAIVQRSLPPGLKVDPWNDAAWVGLVPLFMRDVRPRFVPAIPALSDFLELNLRTYVYDATGRPGIYFYSLDCNQPLAVETARRLLHLRYEHCAIEAAKGEGSWIDFRAERKGCDESSAFRYRAFGPAVEAGQDTLEFFLIERYRLFGTDRDGERLHSIRVCHEPYRIRTAHVTTWSDVALRQAGFESPQRDPDHVCAADPLEVEVFPPEKV